MPSDLNILEKLKEKGRLCKDLFVVELGRDPLDMYKSATNLTLSIWLNIITGIFPKRNLQESWFYKYGNRDNFCNYFLNWPGMHTSLKLYDVIKPLAEEYIFAPISFLTAKNIPILLNNLKSFFNLTPYKEEIPDISPFSLQNRFVKEIKRLTIKIDNKELDLCPCPVIFRRFYHFNEKNEAWRNAGEYFPLGKFDGEIGLYCETKVINSELMVKLREYLSNHEYVIFKYFKDIEARNYIVKRYSSDLYINNNIIRDIIDDNEEIKENMKNYLSSWLRYQAQKHPDYLKECHNSINLYMDIFKNDLLKSLC